MFNSNLFENRPTRAEIHLSNLENNISVIITYCIDGKHKQLLDAVLALPRKPRSRLVLDRRLLESDALHIAAQEADLLPVVVPEDLRRIFAHCEKV